MKNASRLMYRIGIIVNIVEIVLCALMITMGAIFLFAAPLFSETSKEENVRGAGIAFLLFFGIALLVLLVVLILACRIRKALEKLEKEKAPHIGMILLGFFGVIFYSIGGIFGFFQENSGEEEPVAIEGEKQALPNLSEPLQKEEEAE